ncbi:hypothetical protein [Streptomyces fragilis]|uniref:Secreted protein n=1 Tax=Streptomyces fragilis TaxID=67301 RepID=A0ABV2YKV6_9ACTN|nr:hypothetical protein [Streptomyces fragilis]
MRLASTIRTALAAATLAAGTLIGTAAPANALPCGRTHNITIDGAAARVLLACEDRYTRMSGWGKDTRTDGLCAQLSVFPEGRGPVARHRHRACGEGTARNFSNRYYGRSVGLILEIILA